MKEKIINKILAQKIIAIIRVHTQAQVDPTLKLLIDAGIKVLEITSNTPGFEEEIRKAQKKYPTAVIGAGTIRNVKLAQEAIDNNAQFLVTPNTNEDVVRLGHEYEIPVLMGAMTPSEISVALDCGADFIKLFPAGVLGIDYYKALLGPFHYTRFIAVGGIGLGNASAWFEAGVCGVGIGADLTKGDLNEVKRKVQSLLQSIK